MFFIEEKNKNFFKKCLIFSLTNIITICLCILFYLLFRNINSITEKLGIFFGILRPIIFGFIIAYLFKPMCVFFCNTFNKFICFCNKNKRKNKVLLFFSKRKDFIVSIFSIITTYIVVIAIILAIFGLIIPQIVNSVPEIVSTISNSVVKFQDFLNQNKENEIVLQITDMLSKIDIDFSLESLGAKFLSPYTAELIQHVSEGTLRTVTIFKDLLIGLVVAFYVLLSRKRIAKQANLILCAFVPRKISSFIIDELKYADVVFNKFLVGKIIDSVIVGVITYFCLLIFGIPYALIIALIIGITNIIPIFGPIVGAIPCILFLLVMNPIKSLTFAIFILILQQIDGHIIGPKIVGSATGISGLWILVSILVFGGLFGFLGMIIGVPLLAVISDVVNKAVRYLLSKRGETELLKQCDDYLTRKNGGK